jgi:hypothetical protein
MTQQQEDSLSAKLIDRVESCVCLGRSAYGEYIKKQVAGMIHDIKEDLSKFELLKSSIKKEFKDEKITLGEKGEVIEVLGFFIIYRALEGSYRIDYEYSNYMCVAFLSENNSVLDLIRNNS